MMVQPGRKLELMPSPLPRTLPWQVHKCILSALSLPFMQVLAAQKITGFNSGPTFVIQVRLLILTLLRHSRNSDQTGLCSLRPPARLTHHPVRVPNTVIGE